MKKIVSIGLVFSFMLFPSLSQAALTPIAIPAEQRIQLSNFTDTDFLELGTNGDEIYYWDNVERRLFILNLATGEVTATEQGDAIFDLHVRAGKILYHTADRSQHFEYITEGETIRNQVETGRFVDGIGCFDGIHVGYQSDAEFWVYDLDTNEQELISDKIAPNYFFCSIDNGYVSFNDVENDQSRVKLKRLGGPTIELSQTQDEGRSSVVIGNTVYYVELFTIYTYDILTGARAAYQEGGEVQGYRDDLGNHFLTFRSSEENGLSHIYLAFPNKSPNIYRISDIDRFAGVYSFYNGIVTWIEFQNSKKAIFATNMFAFDSDLDGVSDINEIFQFGTDAFLADTDGDGYDDGTEIANGYDPLRRSVQVNESQPQPEPMEEEMIEKIDEALIDSVAGKILLQVESRGEAWYVDPITRKRYYMKDGAAAFQMLRSFGLGISNADLNRIPSDQSFTNGLLGRILLQVEENGEAWYVLPSSGNRIYMKNGEVAYDLMRETGLGITNADLAKIPIGTL